MTAQFFKLKENYIKFKALLEVSQISNKTIHKFNSHS